jgi:hypothetical protein
MSLFDVSPMNIVCRHVSFIYRIRTDVKILNTKYGLCPLLFLLTQTQLSFLGLKRQYFRRVS